MHQSLHLCKIGACLVPERGMRVKMQTESKEPLNFEIALKDLESMIEKMAGGQLSLEESLKNFEQGIALARECQTALKDAEQKVQILISQNGEFETKAFIEE